VGKYTQPKEETPENIEYQALTFFLSSWQEFSPKTKANPPPESSPNSRPLLFATGFVTNWTPGNFLLGLRVFSMRFAVFVILVFLSALPLRAAGELQTLPSARLVPTTWADGDSFLVRFADPATGQDREEVFRLYAVDCMETLYAQESDRRRLLEQARHFGVEKPALLIAEGRAATAFVKAQLAQPFTVHTAFSQALGRSGKPRYYAFIVLAEGRDLAAELVRRGLARVKGVSRETPAGVPRDEYEVHLADLELAAAMQRAGVWRLSNPARLAEARAEKRREDRELAAIRAVPAERALDLNTATAEEIQTLPGIGPALAGRILEGRPYRSPHDLLKVKGIGKSTLEKLKPLLQGNLRKGA
jgi:DNA uptake protein ComE-like DNA-binding protein